MDLAGFGIVLAILSVVVFIIGFVMLIFNENKKTAVKILIGSIIGFIVGFGTCLTNISLGGMH